MFAKRDAAIRHGHSGASPDGSPTQRGVSSWGRTTCKEMSCAGFFEVARDVQCMTPHISEIPRPANSFLPPASSCTPLAPMMICDHGPSPAELLLQRIKLLSVPPVPCEIMEIVHEMQTLHDNMAFGSDSDDEERVVDLCRRTDSLVPTSMTSTFTSTYTSSRSERG